MARSKLDETRDFIDLFEYLGGDWIVPGQFLRWTALSLIAGCVEDRAWYNVVEHAPLYPNVWVFLIGTSGTGKDVSIGQALHLLKPEDPVWKIDGKVTIPALYDYMAKMQRSSERPSAPVYLVSSDVTEQLPLGPEAKDFTSRVLSLYGGRNRVLTDLTRTSGDKVITRPLLNWVAGCTKEWFPQAIDPLVFNSGFAGRAFFIIGEPVLDNYHKQAPTRRHDHDLVMDHLRTRVELYQTLEGMFSMSERAQLGYNQWLAQQQERLRSLSLSDVERAVMTRTRMSVLKLAMLYALARWQGNALLIIKGAHMSRAITTVQDIMHGVVQVSDFAYVTVDTAVVDKVREHIRTQGVVRRDALMRFAQKRGVKSAKQLDEILDFLKQGGQIHLEKRRPTKAGGPWPTFISWKTRKVILTDAAEPQEIPVMDPEPLEEPAADEAS